MISGKSPQSENGNNYNINVYRRREGDLILIYVYGVFLNIVRLINICVFFKPERIVIS